MNYDAIRKYLYRLRGSNKILDKSMDRLSDIYIKYGNMSFKQSQLAVVSAVTSQGSISAPNFSLITNKTQNENINPFWTDSGNPFTNQIYFGTNATSGLTTTPFISSFIRFSSQTGMTIGAFIRIRTNGISLQTVSPNSVDRAVLVGVLVSNTTHKDPYIYYDVENNTLNYGLVQNQIFLTRKTEAVNFPSLLNVFFVIVNDGINLWIGVSTVNNNPQFTWYLICSISEMNYTLSGAYIHTGMMKSTQNLNTVWTQQRGIFTGVLPWN